MKIASDHPALAGHFPNNPIVPGVIILDEVIQALRLQLAMPVRIIKISAAKFMAPLLPMQAFVINFVSRQEEGKMAFEVSVDNKKVATGVIGYAVVRGGL